MYISINISIKNQMEIAVSVHLLTSFHIEKSSGEKFREYRSEELFGGLICPFKTLKTGLTCDNCAILLWTMPTWTPIPRWKLAKYGYIDIICG